MELQDISEVESNNLSETDIDLFETMYGEMDEVGFPLFRSDKIP